MFSSKKDFARSRLTCWVPPWTFRVSSLSNLDAHRLRPVTLSLHQVFEAASCLCVVEIVQHRQPANMLVSSPSPFRVYSVDRSEGDFHRILFYQSRKHCTFVVSLKVVLLRNSVTDTSNSITSFHLDESVRSILPANSSIFCMKFM